MSIVYIYDETRPDSMLALVILRQKFGMGMALCWRKNATLEAIPVREKVERVYNLTGGVNALLDAQMRRRAWWTGDLLLVGIECNEKQSIVDGALLAVGCPKERPEICGAVESWYAGERIGRAPYARLAVEVLALGCSWSYATMSQGVLNECFLNRVESSATTESFNQYRAGVAYLDRTAARQLGNLGDATVLNLAAVDMLGWLPVRVLDSFNRSMDEKDADAPHAVAAIHVQFVGKGVLVTWWGEDGSEPVTSGLTWSRTGSARWQSWIAERAVWTEMWKPKAIVGRVLENVDSFVS